MLHGSRNPPERTTQLLIRSPRRRATPSPPALHKPAGRTQSVGRIVRLPQKGRLVLGTDLNRSESRFERFGACSIWREKIAQPTMPRPAGYGISTRAMLILGLRGPHAVSSVRFTPRSGHAPTWLKMPVQRQGAIRRLVARMAGSRTSCSCSLPVSDKLATSAGSRLARRVRSGG